MQIQKVSNPMLSKNNSIKEKRNQPNFSGYVHLLEPELEAIPELKSFKKLVEEITDEKLDIFVKRMPSEEAERVKVETRTNKLITKLQNLKITYLNSDKHTLRVSGIYLHPNKKQNKMVIGQNNNALRDDLLTNASESMGEWIANVEKLLSL